MPVRARRLLPTILLIGTAVSALGVDRGGGRGSDGGTFRVSFQAGLFDSIDPAVGGQPLLDLTCAHLMNYPDKAAPAGLRIVPEVAAAHPRVSGGGTRFTFTLRRGF